MIKVPIEFHSPEDVLQFVNIVSKYSCDIDLKCGRYIVDAKSVVSAFALSSSKNVEMVVHDNDYKELIEHVSKYVSHRQH